VPRKLRPWDLFLLFALLALVQGALAFRGVSAIYLIAVAGFAAWLAGWRLHLSYADDEFVLRARRSPLLGLAQEQSGRSALACDES
jgi:hypothetical protein